MTSKCFNLYRQNSQGGGLTVGNDENIESTLVREGNDEIEAIVVQVVLGQIPVQIIVAYGPQEMPSRKRKKSFRRFWMRK